MLQKIQSDLKVVFLCHTWDSVDPNKGYDLAYNTLKPLLSGFHGTRAFPDVQNSGQKKPTKIAIGYPH